MCEGRRLRLPPLLFGVLVRGDWGGIVRWVLPKCGIVV
jgi:hypothetical protein